MAINEKNGKPAITHYKVLQRFAKYTYMEFQLETGRTHQIRAHMKHIGHPLFNDERYGGNEILRGTQFSKYKQFIQNCFAVCPRQHSMPGRGIHTSAQRTGDVFHFGTPGGHDGTIGTVAQLHRAQGYGINRNISLL